MSALLFDTIFTSQLATGSMIPKQERFHYSDKRRWCVVLFIPSDGIVSMHILRHFQPLPTTLMMTASSLTAILRLLYPLPPLMPHDHLL